MCRTGKWSAAGARDPHRRRLLAGAVDDTEHFRIPHPRRGWATRHTADAADRSVRNFVLAGAMLAVSFAAFVVSLILANRIVRRLEHLRDKTLVLADEKLPETINKLRDGQQVEAATETPVLDLGIDEIGQYRSPQSEDRAPANRRSSTRSNPSKRIRYCSTYCSGSIISPPKNAAVPTILLPLRAVRQEDGGVIGRSLELLTVSVG